MTPKKKITKSRFASLLLAQLVKLVALLVAAGWPGLSPWWTDTLSRFIKSQRPQLVARVGRQGGKSSMAVLFAVAFALVYSGLGLVPPGDVAWVVVVSVRREEALSRLETIKKVLRAIGVQFTPGDGDAIIIVGTNIGFRVQACTVAATSGWTSILLVCDEVSKWSEQSTGANPATEVLASLRPTMVTQGEHARILLISSPFGSDDAHAKAFDEGDTHFQIVAFAETWIAAPHVSEALTHDLEKDPKRWAREYAARPGQASSDAFDADLVRAALRPCPAFVPYPAPLMLIDSSAGRGDAFVWALAQRFTAPNGREAIHVGALAGFDGKFRKDVSWDRAIDHMVATAKAKANGAISFAVSDNYQDFAMASALQKHAIEHRTMPWTAESKVDAVGTVRRWLRDGVLFVEPGIEGEKWRSEMIAFKEKLTPNGFTAFGARQGGHDDRVALLLNLALADQAQLFARNVRPLRIPSLPHFPAAGAGFEDLEQRMVIVGGPPDPSASSPQGGADAVMAAELARYAGGEPGQSRAQPSITLVPHARDPLTEGF